MSVGTFVLWPFFGACLSFSISWSGCLYSNTHLVLSSRLMWLFSVFLFCPFLPPPPPLISRTLLLQYIDCVSLSFTPPISINYIFREFTLTINMLTLAYPHIFLVYFDNKNLPCASGLFFSAESIRSAFATLKAL